MPSTLTLSLSMMLRLTTGSGCVPGLLLLSLSPPVRPHCERLGEGGGIPGLLCGCCRCWLMRTMAIWGDVDGESQRGESGQGVLQRLREGGGAVGGPLPPPLH